MTRQWLATPEYMCKQHIMGEHAETHGFIDKMTKGHSLEGFREGSMFFGAEFILARHDLLVPFIPGHGSPLVITDQMKRQYPLICPTIEDVKKSVGTLISRCPECARLYV